MKHSGSEYIMQGLFVDDMIHIYSCDAMIEIKDEFMQLYSRDLEITGGSQMKTFPGMQVDQTARSIKIHLDHYIKEVVAEYVEYIRNAIRPKKVPIAPNVDLRPEDTPYLPDPRKQKIYSFFMARRCFSSQPHGPPSLCHSWLSFAYRLDLRIGQHFTALRSTWQVPLALRSHIDEARAAPTCCRATPIQIGGIAVHGDHRLVHSCCTTRHQSCGSRRCRRLRLSPRQRPHTTLHPQPLLRSCISAPFWNDSSEDANQCVRTTPCVSSGATTLLTDVNEPSV
jgi:hypothetical protein